MGSPHSGLRGYPMPVILSQHYLATDRVYQDVEYGLYHYPRQYFNRIRAYDKFIYYRPLGESKRRSDSLHYFGYGILGQPFLDFAKADHRFVPVITGKAFPTIVPIKDTAGFYYETETNRPPVAVSAVREISDVTYYRILAAAGVFATALERAPSTEDVPTLYSALPLSHAPTDSLREITQIPPGAGYIPTGKPVNVVEAALLQERARADHQTVLKHLVALIHEQGGRTWCDNYIDLLGDVGGDRMLIEAKSLNDTADAVHRMRYGMGQLFDYRHRYATKIGEVKPVLAFGRLPERSDLWIGSALEENGVAFVGQTKDEIVPLNELAESLSIFR